MANWCVQWRQSFKYKAEIAEFNIDFKTNKDKRLINFLETYSTNHQRVNIRLSKEDDIDKALELLTGIKEKYPNFNIALMLEPSLLYSSIFTSKLVCELKCPAYFETIFFNWDSLYEAAATGVSEVFIGGELGFDLPKVREFCNRHEMRIRAYPNLASSAWFGMTTNSFKTFFIRPEDIDFYSQFIDIFEFYKGINEQNVNYHIYEKSKKYPGPFKEFITYYTTDEDNHFIYPKNFAEMRHDCRKRCLYKNNCHFCDSVASLATEIKNNPEYDLLDKVQKE